MARHISIVAHCYNEEGNVREVYERVKTVMRSLPGYSYEHIFIDNASQDATQDILKDIAGRDRNVKVILNTRNFGQVRSARHAMLQAKGDAVICIVADLQDPPEMIPDFIRKWEEGYPVVVGVRPQSEAPSVFTAVRNAFYNLMGRLSEVPLIKNFSGFGLYDRKVMQAVGEIDNPYFRGLICDIGFDRAEIVYKHPKRKRGITKHNFYTLYDMAMGGITHHSKVPLRLATMSGFFLAAVCLLITLGYFVYKIMFWDRFSLGIAPLVIGFFFFGAVQLIFIGVIGEYIGSIHTQVLRHPLIIERERINFDEKRDG